MGLGLGLGLGVRGSAVMGLHLGVVRAVLDGEGRGGAVAAVGDALDLDEVGPTPAHELHVLAERLGVPPVDERQPEDLVRVSVGVIGLG